MEVMPAKTVDNSENALQVEITPTIIPFTPELVCEQDRQFTQEVFNSEQTKLPLYGAEMLTTQEDPKLANFTTLLTNHNKIPTHEKISEFAMTDKNQDDTKEKKLTKDKKTKTQHF